MVRHLLDTHSVGANHFLINSFRCFLTKQHEVAADPRYKTVLDHGFVGIVDTFGTDSSIVQAARVSYGDGTKTVNEDRGLLRYLMRHKHTSPFEMCQVKLHIKLPIFIMRQWVRHRTASLNEYSGRYSVMTDEFYVPSLEQIKPQSSNNKQGRSGDISESDATAIQGLMSDLFEQNYDLYQKLLAEETKPEETSDEFNGIARELARTILPVANYTELYWSQNLHNMMHLMKLRLDPHAQYEVRVFAQAVYDLLEPIYPLAFEAFNDYVLHSVSHSRMEIQLMEYIMAFDGTREAAVADLITEYQTAEAIGKAFGMAASEVAEFSDKWKLDLPRPKPRKKA